MRFDETLVDVSGSRHSSGPTIGFVGIFQSLMLLSQSSFH